MDEACFDAQGLFDEDYLHFYAEAFSDERSETETELLWRPLELQPGMELLDLACGHGRIANRLADRGVTVDYLEGDMRSLPGTGRFDRVVNWFTAFCYFDDAGNRPVLAEVARALKPGVGLLWSSSTGTGSWVRCSPRWCWSATVIC